MNRRIPSRIAVTFGAALILALTGFGASAQTGDSVQFQIPPQPLSDALILFGDQSGQGVMADSVATETLNSPGYTGEAVPEIALRQLLEGTGLTYRQDGDVFVIVSPASSSIAGQNTVGQRRPGIEEIIVTGQKREERIQDVPIAISAFTQEDLTTSQIAGGPDLHLQVPNMTFTKTNFTGYSIQIRGIGTQAISATTDPAVAVALNNTSFIRNRFFEQEFYDLERVEVLRGPQGTLFGRNATAGVVNLVTAKPTFEEEAMGSLDIGNYNSRRWEFMVNTPLVEDAVAFRLAGAGTTRDGYATNEITGNPIDGRDLWSTRASLRFAPTGGNFDINLIWEHFEEDDDRLRSGKQLCKKHVIEEVGGVPVDYFQIVPDTGSTGNARTTNVQSAFSQGCERNSLYAEDSFQTPNGMSIPYYYQIGALPNGAPRALRDPYASTEQSSDLRVIESIVDPEYRAETDIVELQIGLELTDGLTLDSETAYLTDTIFSSQDFNRFNTARGAWTQQRPQDRIGLLQEGSEGGIFCDPQLGCSDRLVAVGLSTADSTQFSQELRLSSQFAGPFDFSLGANYLRYKTEDKYYVFVNSLSMTAAAGGGDNIPYIPGETDNAHCLDKWLEPGDPSGVYQVSECIYIDPNPIDSLNDKGHNYFLSRNPYDLTSYAAFGEAYYKFTDNLKLTAGLRWSVDKKEAPRIPTWLLAGGTYDLPVADVNKLTWREPTGRLVLDWKPNLDFTDETLVYGSYSRGYKAGGANPPTFVYSFFGTQGADAAKILRNESVTRPKTFDAEFVDAFEIGTKNTLADGAVTLNAAAFYYDYEGYQISEIVDRSAFNRNFDAEVWGAELEADWWVTEALRLGFKGGYQRTRIRDGEQAVDLMDRTARGTHLTITDVQNPNYTGTPGEGRPRSEYVATDDTVLEGIPEDQEFFAFEDWTIVRPFPTFASNCILPTWMYVPPGGTAESHGSDPLFGPGSPNGGGPGGCELAYIFGLDPMSEAPYEPTPPSGGNLGFWESNGVDYPGFNPEWAPNNGEGFFKDLGGNELPNTPHYTMTFKVDYTIPLGGDWLVTAHSDIYWQSKSWWRIFNDHEYNRLDEYFTMNVAAIFRNEVAGWDIMAYVKNVTDEDAITGGFLGSDDTGLTTNVFLVEPRLYGVRVTKRWGDGAGGPVHWMRHTAELFGKKAGEPTPFSLTLGGQIPRYDAPYANLMPTFADAFAPPLDAFAESQNRGLDWGDSREIEVGYRPNGSPWKLSVGIRSAKANGGANRRVEQETAPACLFGGFIGFFCDTPLDDPLWSLIGEENQIYLAQTETNWLETEVDNREEHRLIDVVVSRDNSFLGLETSAFSVGLRHARFKSETTADFFGIPDWNLEDAVYRPGGFPIEEVPATHTRYLSEVDARREFEGVGPTVSWEAAYPLLGSASTRLDLTWLLTAGVLLGERETTVSGIEEETAAELSIGSTFDGENIGYGLQLGSTERSSFRHERSDSATVPVFEAELGLSYQVGSASIGAGYRWERYSDVLDAGFDERKDYDRTIDGPYLNVTFGGGE